MQESDKYSHAPAKAAVRPQQVNFLFSSGKWLQIHAGGQTHYKHRKQLHSTINSCKAPTGTCGQLRKTIQYEPLVNGFGCTMTGQYGNRHRLRTRRSLGASCSCGHDSCRPCCVASYTMCVRFCVANGTRKILPWTMWLSSEEHTFAKEVDYVVVSTTH